MPILHEETNRFPEDVLENQHDLGEDRQWWAVYTKSRQEKALARSLLGLKVPFYLPLIQRDNAVRGRRTRSHVPMFSGYLFVCGSESERIRVLATNRISRLIQVPDQTRLVRDLRYLDRLITSGVPLTLESRLEPGQGVRIKTGPMLGAEGVVISRRGQSRLLLAVQFLQQGVSVEIEDYQVESID
ncbi:MAG: antitermination protein NusG [Planctomycetota bacterium]|nr:antitermination protein NusG [Planctomycetota bacterium]MDA1177227.1 antitermination protein NusG [Planctomycetota bacterium]